MAQNERALYPVPAQMAGSRGAWRRFAAARAFKRHELPCTNAPYRLQHCKIIHCNEHPRRVAQVVTARKQALGNAASEAGLLLKRRQDGGGHISLSSAGARHHSFLKPSLSLLKSWFPASTPPGKASQPAQVPGACRPPSLPARPPVTQQQVGNAAEVEWGRLQSWRVAGTPALHFGTRPYF